jgi:hypothetical protein
MNTRHLIGKEACAAQGCFSHTQPARGWSLRLSSCLSRMGQATEAKRLASRGLQGLAQYAKRSAWGPHLYV